ncbi:protein tesmin/TSO1-like CXC 2 [Momordica charantia]|uniref:Protein tesmin/TSO1-like CXC 2 n=1 Tax=Momordica charantia TaxID=3673 RepID=A0A6J1C8W0_MOMCH|nr:protein tesmin/TSO1-like CXC 2 [Momordica charantia]
MDTPERNQIGTTSVSKFEDSPVFNYINNLSPIQPVKSIHTTQTFNSLSFASLPSVFTSPHVSSYKESRFLRRHSDADLSKPDFSSENGNKVGTDGGVTGNVAQLPDNSSVPHGNSDSLANPSTELPSEHLLSTKEEPQATKCDSPRPDCDQKLPDCVIKLGEDPPLSNPCVQNKSGNGSSEAEGNKQVISHTEEREGTGYDWESLITEGADLLIFSSPNGSEAIRLVQKPLDLVTGFTSSTLSQIMENDNTNLSKMRIADPIESSGVQHEIEFPSSQAGEACEIKDMDQAVEGLSYPNSNNSMSREITDDEVAKYITDDCKPVSNLYRGMRRRCLDFEAAVSRRKNLEDGSNSGSVSTHAEEKMTSMDKQLIPYKSGGVPARCMLTGIGLHLNALATTSKDTKNLNHEKFSSERQLSLPNSSASCHSPSTGLDPLLTSVVTERDVDPSENGVQNEEDASRASAYVLAEDFNQNSPKKKRRRLEHAGETESSCKRCNCKKSKCLKLYCECFAAGVYCIEPCSCQDCFNKPIHEDTVLATRKQIESRNPLAFAPKVIRNSDSLPEPGDESNKTPASARHKRGCNCKKSSCLKKYCECYQGGVGCSISCRCEGCKNAFGRKDGSSLLGIETEQEEEETESNQKSVVDKALQGPEIQNNEEQNPGSAIPSTPLQLCRQLVSLPFSSRGKPLRSSFLNVGSSSGFYAGHKLEKPNILRPQPDLGKNTKPVSEDEMPDILRGDCSPGAGVKTGSPNSKRISPPQSDFGLSPLPRTGRKLILQSIPSFPSLTPQH